MARCGVVEFCEEKAFVEALHETIADMAVNIIIVSDYDSVIYSHGESVLRLSYMAFYSKLPCKIILFYANKNTLAYRFST